MSKYSAYIKRVTIDGETHLDGFRNSTKRQAHNYILNSPSKSVVEILNLQQEDDKTVTLSLKEKQFCIVSDKDSFYKRTILHLPDNDVPLGSYMKYDNKIYLSTKVSDVDVYPQSYVDYCNHEIKLQGAETKILVGYDSMKRPQYKIVKPEFNMPCVVTSKIYSELDNSQIPLPEGAILVYLPYHELINIPLNYEFKILDDAYQVTTVNKINVLKDEHNIRYGYLEIRCQRDVKK